MGAGRTLFMIFGSPAYYLFKFLFLAIIGRLILPLPDSAIVSIIILIVLGLFLHLAFGIMHEKIFGFRYGSWNDNASSEKYISGYKGTVSSGFLSDNVTLKPVVTSEKEQGNTVLGFFILFDLFVMWFGGSILEDTYPALLIFG
jgi:hypothetical protein